MRRQNAFANAMRSSRKSQWNCSTSGRPRSQRRGRALRQFRVSMWSGRARRAGGIAKLAAGADGTMAGAGELQGLAAHLASLAHRAHRQSAGVAAGAVAAARRRMDAVSPSHLAGGLLRQIGGTSERGGTPHPRGTDTSGEAAAPRLSDATSRQVGPQLCGGWRGGAAAPQAGPRLAGGWRGGVVRLSLGTDAAAALSRLLTGERRGLHHAPRLQKMAIVEGKQARLWSRKRLRSMSQEDL
mmetsp:Transcript_29446/g.83041  ORF Transcript_29446/g.83041 Transcript_29446/m.83041 type:complete len:241 (-) Transcript_29446:811-1533(-)